MNGLDGKISVIIPAYNEGHSIYINLGEIKKTFDEFGCDYELIICDDGSRDLTFHEINRFRESFPDLRLVITNNRHNYGKGRALKKAFKYVTGDYVIWLDGDLDLHPFQIPTFFDIMRFTKADIVIGSKRHPNSVLHYPFNRRIMSIVYFTLIKLMFNLPINDTQTGLKLFRKKALGDAFKRIVVKKFAFDLEVLVITWHLGYKIAEAPVYLKSQRNFGGRIGVMSIFHMIWDTMAIWYRMYILKYYDRINHYRRKGLAQELKKVRRKIHLVYEK